MKRQKLETAILEIISQALAFDQSATFDILGCELWKDDCGQWSFNNAFYLVRNADLPQALETTRGRWEAFKGNYQPRARVADLMALEWIPGDRSLYVECDSTSFLEIRVNYTATI